MPRPPAGGSAMEIVRGSIWWVEFDPTIGSEIRKTRPAVVLTADSLNRVRRTVVVVPLSTGPGQRPPIVLHVPSAGQGSMAVCDQIRAVDRSRLMRPSGSLSREDLKAVEDSVRTILRL